ncbi:MAG TPA: DUF4097 family beta strand repeat-containing protein [Phycisphaerae bacterium]|nr:DUF4097 family beta strand repeat-containing protein [Phycisphaerae bacterium]
MFSISRRASSPVVRSIAVVLALGSVALVATGCGTPFKTQEQLTLTAPASAEKLIVENNIGDVTIRADAQAKEVSAVITKIGRGATLKEAEKALAELEVTLAMDDTGALRATVDHPRATSFRQHEVVWAITTPPTTEVRVTTDIGDATVNGIHKDVAIKTDIGDARVSCDPAASSAVTISTGVGDVHVSDARGLTAKTDVGDIHASAGGPIQLDSDVGDVVLHLKPATSERVRIESDVGDVCLYLDPGQQGKLTATTDVGSVRVALDGVTMREFRHRDHFAVAQLGESATPSIDIFTDVGDVTIKSQPADTPATKPATALSAVR